MKHLSIIYISNNIKLGAYSWISIIGTLNCMDLLSRRFAMSVSWQMLKCLALTKRQGFFLTPSLGDAQCYRPTPPCSCISLAQSNPRTYWKRECLHPFNQEKFATTNESALKLFELTRSATNWSTKYVFKPYVKFFSVGHPGNAVMSASLNWQRRFPGVAIEF